MIALDTNILVRFFAKDDEAQWRKVHGLLGRKDTTFFVCDLVLVETQWVLRSVYEWTCAEVADAFFRLTSIHNLEFENEARLRLALNALQEGADLADELIVRASRERGAQSFATFEKGIIRRHKDFATSP
jgi:predicted nucleic-acid-binding protein